jgi:hypothetical protein
MIDRFPELLQELATELDIDLYPDKRGACKLVTEDGLHVQMEVDIRQESLLIASFICEIPPGKFRENILRDALKSNGPFPKNGTLAYSDRNNKLTLFSHLRIAHLTGRKIAEFLGVFIDKANQWRKAVDTGNTSHLITMTSPKPTSGMFGLKP